MTEDVHLSAERLILREHVEHISPQEREWLDRHLENCPDCTRLAGATGQALQSLRAVSIPLPPALASRTQLRVYLRAQERRERERGGWVLWTSCGLSCAIGIASAPYVWRAFEWIGHRTGLPALAWQSGFAMWWALPALLAVAIVLIDRIEAKV